MGRRIRTRRLHLDGTIVATAKAAEISAGQFKLYESGQGHPPVHHPGDIGLRVWHHISSPTLANLTGNSPPYWPGELNEQVLSLFLSLRLPRKAGAAEQEESA